MDLLLVVVATESRAKLRFTRRSGGLLVVEEVGGEAVVRILLVQSEVLSAQVVPEIEPGPVGDIDRLVLAAPEQRVVDEQVEALFALAIQHPEPPHHRVTVLRAPLPEELCGGGTAVSGDVEWGRFTPLASRLADADVELDPVRHVDGHVAVEEFHQVGLLGQGDLHDAALHERTDLEGLPVVEEEILEQSEEVRFVEGKWEQVERAETALVNARERLRWCQ